MIENIDNEMSEENNQKNDETEVHDKSEIEDLPSENNLHEQSSDNNEEVESLDKDNTKLLEEELEDTKDKLLRALAENENIRKQMDKTRQEGIKYGVQPLAREIINIVDNFDRALNTKYFIPDSDDFKLSLSIEAKIYSDNDCNSKPK